MNLRLMRHSASSVGRVAEQSIATNTAAAAAAAAAADDDRSTSCEASSQAWRPCVTD